MRLGVQLNRMNENISIEFPLGILIHLFKDNARPRPIMIRSTILGCSSMFSLIQLFALKINAFASSALPHRRRINEPLENFLPEYLIENGCL